MMNTNKKTPKLRFQGFTDDWEQRKLGDIVDFLDGQRKPLKESDRIKGKYPYYGASGIIDYINDYLFDENLVLLSEDGANIIDRNYPICFIATGKYWVNNHAHVLKVKTGVIDRFICESLERLDYTKFNTGTAQPKLNQDICQRIVITIPNEAEQKCISEFLDRINNIITLHQRKLEKLKLNKSAFLQKMFPQNECTVPEVRFKGFTEDWEQRKADYIFKSIADKGYPELPVLSASQELGMVYRDQNGIDIQHDKKNEISYKRVLPGQFVIHLRSFQGGFAYSEVEGITSPAYTVMSFKNPSEQYGLFWKHVFKSETFIKRLETITYGIRDGRSISFSDFKSLILQYPSFSEQKLIGDSIAVIERGITLHQRKLDHLMSIKKALLQQLFV